MPRALPFLKFFIDMGSTVLCRVHTGLLCVLQQTDRCIIQSLYGVIHLVASTLGLCMQTHGYQSLLPGRHPLLKIVLSQTPQQRVTMLSSDADLQPQLSFNLLCSCSPTHLGFFQDYISSCNSANISFTYSVCWITRCE